MNTIYNINRKYEIQKEQLLLSLCSDKGLMLELSAFLRFTVANLRHCPWDEKKKERKKNYKTW